jgi:hypothetical protein
MAATTALSNSFIASILQCFVLDRANTRGIRMGVLDSRLGISLLDSARLRQDSGAAAADGGGLRRDTARFQHDRAIRDAGQRVCSAFPRYHRPSSIFEVSRCRSPSSF